jgi:hypothetical protein
MKTVAGPVGLFMVAERPVTSIQRCDVGFSVLDRRFVISQKKLIINEK